MALRPAGGGLNTKRYILAALTAIIVVSTLVIVFSVVTSPAHIDFSITHAEHRFITDAGGSSVQVNFTIAANSTSRRAAARYVGIFVDVSRSNASQLATTNSVRANLISTGPLHQQPRTGKSETTTTTFAASVSMASEGEAFTTNQTSGFAVMIVATTRFRVGIIRTRLYDIKVSCEPVDFFSAAGWPVHCQQLAIN